MVAPWSPFWFRNVFAEHQTVAELLANPFVRGGVTGIGLVTAVAGLAELAGIFSRRRSQEPSEPPAP